MIAIILKFFASDVAAKGIAVLFIPLFSYLLGPTQLGYFSEWFSLFNVFVAIISMGVPSYILVLLSRAPEDEVEIRQKSYRFLIEWFCLAGLLCIGAAFFVENIYYSIVLFVASVCFVIINYIAVVLRYRKAFKKYFYFQIALSMATSTVPLVFVYLDPQWESRAVGYLAGVFCLVAIVSVQAVQGLKVEAIDSAYRKQVITFGSSIVLMAMVTWCKVGADIQLLKYLDGYHSSGILFFSFQIVSVVSIVAASLNRSSAPVLYELLKNKHSQQFWMLIVKLGGGVSTLSIVVVLASWFLVEGYLQDFSTAERMIIPMSIGAVLYGIGQFIGSAFLFHKKPQLLTLAILISSLLHPAMSYLLISFQGWDNIGISYLLSSSIFLFLVIVLYKKLNNGLSDEDRIAKEC